MPLYRASCAQLRAQVFDWTLVPTIAERFRHSLGYSPPPAEVRAWERSLHAVSADLIQAHLDDVEILVEHRLPFSSKRVDVVLCGVHPRTGHASYVVIELKQWTKAWLLDGITDVCEVDGTRGDRLHPGSQVGGYCEYLRDFVAVLSEPATAVAGAAYLHNATDADVVELFDRPETETSRVFTGQRRAEFIEWLQANLAPSAGAAAADALLGSATRPSRQLLDCAAEEVQRREQFVLLEEQRVAYALVLRAVERARADDAKEVIVVTGGPGSGKSVIALSLLGELARQGRTVLHATGSSAFTQTLRRVASRRAPQVRTMFKYFNQFSQAERNGLDVLLCDEAHRIRETSVNRYTRADLRTDRPQVDELIDAARVPVFLLDEHQVVRPGEIGTVADIEAAAARKGLEVRIVRLDGQFRCGGSRAYEHWVLRFLHLVPGGAVEWHGDDGFALHVADSPEQMEDLLRQRIVEGDSARIAAGYCWRWSEPRADGSLAEDVVIGDWRRPWNNPKETRHGGAPGRAYWASDPAGFGQVGCVYTAQGFEYAWAGVILGDDLVWRGGTWVAQPQASRDSQVKKAPLTEFDRAVRNTYKVLLTRGLSGAVVMSTDPETQAHLRSLVRGTALADVGSGT